MINSIFNKIKKTTKHNIFNYYFKTYNSTLFNNSLILISSFSTNDKSSKEIIIDDNISKINMDLIHIVEGENFKKLYKLLREEPSEELEKRIEEFILLPESRSINLMSYLLNINKDFRDLILNLDSKIKFCVKRELINNKSISKYNEEIGYYLSYNDHISVFNSFLGLLISGSLEDKDIITSFNFIGKIYDKLLLAKYIELKCKFNNKKLLDSDRVEELKDSISSLHTSNGGNKESNYFYLGSLIYNFLKSENLVIIVNNEMNNEIKYKNNNSIQPGESLINILKTSKLIDEKTGKIKIPQKLSFFSKLPMIVKPVDYSLNNKYGGYLINKTNLYNPLILKNPNMKVNSTIIKNYIIYDSVNNLMKVGYRINKKLLYYILNNNHIFNFFNNINDFNVLTNTQVQKLKYRDRMDYLSNKSKIELEQNILLLAMLYKDTKAFYFPVKIDFRGRIYVESSYLHYQSIDLAKYLIEYANPVTINFNDDKVYKYLLLSGANAYGLNKYSIDYRLKWVEDNINNIINYLDNNEFLLKAKNPIAFISFCIEYNKYIDAKNKNLNSYESYYSIQLDATCNGFQHISLLLRDLGLTNKLNLKKQTNVDKPDDFYIYITLRLKEYIANNIVNNNNDEDQWLLNIDLSRDFVKKCIMIIPYNATIIKMVDSLKDELEYNNVNKTYCYNNNDKCIELTLPQLFSIVKLILQVLNVYCPKVILFQKYFKNIASIFNQLDLPIPWVIPSGLKINQSYLNTYQSFIHLDKNSNTKVSICINKDTLNTRKQCRALMPNVIHSLDGTSLSLLIYNLFNNIEFHNNFSCIHDCFISSLVDIQLVKNTLLTIYIDIYSNASYLHTFDEDCQNRIKDMIEPPHNVIIEDGKIKSITIQTINSKGKIGYKIIEWPSLDFVNTNTDLSFIKDAITFIN